MARNRLILTVIIGVAAILGTALPASATPAHNAAKASPLAASGWMPRWLRAESGGGCAIPQPARLNPVISYPCQSGNYWEVRYLFGNGSTVGSEVEFVNSSLTLALGFSGGQFKMETPNDNSTYLIIDSISADGWRGLEDSTGTYQMAPNGKGLPLKVLTTGSAFPADGWGLCINTTCTI